jgi:hypothetical protein
MTSARSIEVSSPYRYSPNLKRQVVSVDLDTATVYVDDLDILKHILGRLSRIEQRLGMV